MRGCLAIVTRTEREGGKEVTHLLATTGTPDEWGGAVLVGLGILAYAVMGFVDYLRDVRYYRARKIVRSREGIR